MVKKKRNVVEEDSEMKGYEEAAGMALGLAESDGERQHLEQLFHHPKTHKFYQILREKGVSVRQAADFLRYGAARLVESEEEGVQMNRADFYKAVGEGIKRAGHHEDALYALEKDGYLEPEEREDIRGRIEGRAHSYLENKVAAIWLFMVIGAILMLISGFTMTGAAIGSVFDVSLLFIIGFALFVIGFVLRIKK